MGVINIENNAQYTKLVRWVINLQKCVPNGQCQMLSFNYSLWCGKWLISYQKAVLSLSNITAVPKPLIYIFLIFNSAICC